MLQPADLPMKKRGVPARLLSTIAALLILGSIARAGDDKPPPCPSVEEQVIAAQQAQITANNAADIDALDALTAEDYVGINASGSMQNKSEFLRDVAKRGAARVQATPEQLRERQKQWRVRIVGDFGVVTRLTAGDHGARSWVTAIWARRGGQWVRVFSQVTTVAEK